MEEEITFLRNKKNRKQRDSYPESEHRIGLRNTTEKIFWGIIGGLTLIWIISRIF
jgi:hypothetical protein